MPSALLKCRRLTETPLQHDVNVMPRIATWMRDKDRKYFAPFFSNYSDIEIHDAAHTEVALEKMDGLLLTGGSDVSAQFLRQSVMDASLIRSPDAKRDEWELGAIKNATARAIPIFAICRGVQILNVALGGTLHLDIAGHNSPQQKTADIQQLRNERNARHRFEKVNSSHHQAIDKLGEGLEVEAWCATDDIIEQVRLRDYPFCLGVQYHPERGTIYDALFDDFISHLRKL